MIDLSILVCSVTGRVGGFLPLIINQLTAETKDLNNVEIICLLDNKKITVGQKRNELIRLSNGRYVVFIDDDDRIEWGYVQELLKAIETGCDVICFDVIRYANGTKDKQAKFDVAYQRDSNEGEYYKRIPNHLMCFKREVAIQFPFKNISFGEDAEWAMRIKRALQTQHKIDKVLYHYYYSDTTSETKMYDRH